jgi:membrane-bound lytic murein transglycosylase A
MHTYKLKMLNRNLALVFILLLFTSCAKRHVKPVMPASQPTPITQKCECTTQAVPVTPSVTKSGADAKSSMVSAIPDYSLLKQIKWEDVDSILNEDLSQVWPAWLQSCSTLINKTQWKTACSAANQLDKPNQNLVLSYFKQYFNIFSANNQDGTDTGMITGYYQPLLKGSLTKSSQYPFPIYRQPPDMITVELADIYPELKNKRVRGKLAGNKLLPYYSRAEIDASPSPLSGNELLWINDIIDVFFLQVQGSGLVKLENGDSMHVGYADQNGQAYNSIGRVLVERGELTLDQASMQGIKNWAKNNPTKLSDVLNANPSYVFFRELPSGLSGPLGALGVPLTAERSVAIDPKYIPLGAPLLLSTTEPNSAKPLNRIMVSQDTGGAIKGGVRADFFWGSGDAAGKQAGSMKQTGKIWVLLPKAFQFPN